MIRVLTGTMAAAAVCLASIPLAGCTRDAVSDSMVRSAIVRADTSLERIRKQADRVLPSLAPAAAARVRLGLEIADGAIGAARGATDEDDRAFQLGRAVGAVAAIITAIKGR